MTRQELETIYEAEQDRHVSVWRELVRFPSVSADPARRDDCVACANWLVGRLTAIGFEARLIETSGLPVVHAERPGPPGAPVALYYGHYDVQPVDPADLWRTPPFEPVLKDGRLYGRGAQDNKGQMAYALAALDVLVRHDALTCGVRLVLEGEEESSGPGLKELLERCPELFQADFLLVTDTGMDPSGRPAITAGLRGVVQLEARLRCANKDLHSGIHGGVAPNAAHAAARLAASLHRADGRVAVKGFYDDALEPSPQERTEAGRALFDADAYRVLTGIGPTPGEKRYTLAERVGFRPSLDINGLAAGHAGPGFKTVIPCEAALKISARTVAGQDPDRVLDRLAGHLNEHLPPEASLEIVGRKSAGAALRVPLDAPALRAARAALDNLGAGPAVFRWEGASVPIVADLARVSGAVPVLVGFGMEEDNIHAPNESFPLARFRQGFLFVARLLGGGVASGGMEEGPVTGDQ